MFSIDFSLGSLWGLHQNSAVHPNIVFSDHNPLSFIDKVRCKNQRLLRWRLMLQEFNIEIRHISGKDTIIADALSHA